MSTKVRFHFIEEGRWSGGGDVLLENAREARAHHPILQGGPDSVPILARNVPPLGRYPRRPFVAVPQNAWVWNPVARGAKERSLVSALRLGTFLTYRLASGIVRISEAVPPGRRQATSEILHNVLDRGFEAAAEVDDSGVAALCEGAFVCVGSNYAFRDLSRLVRAHARYRAQGGARRLVLIGAVGSQAAERDLGRELAVAGDSVVRRPASMRSQCLVAMRHAHAVVAPALVEASPVGVMEAGALASRVLLSDIPGHRGVVAHMGGTGGPEFFRTGDEASLATGLAAVDGADPDGWAPWGRTAPQRQAMREEWGHRLAANLAGIAETIGTQRDKGFT